MKLYEFFIFLLLLFKSFFLTEQVYAGESSENVFSRIYERGAWGKDDEGHNYSGEGSTYQNNLFYIDFLEQFIKSHQIKTIVDAGCGDWTFSKSIKWNDVQYIGIDVVKNVIENNISQFTQPNIKFMAADIINYDLPPSDLLLCKDVLQHLTIEDINLFLKQLHKFKYCLITNDIANDLFECNSQINRGKYRPLDLTKPPFNIKGITIFRYDTRVYSRIITKEVLLITNEN
ncbi:MAG: class I SAM-dependent methyltransferase [Parachlamydiales bacterium]|jgi:SAM-dependent methyltransferase